MTPKNMNRLMWLTGAITVVGLGVTIGMLAGCGTEILPVSVDETPVVTEQLPQGVTCDAPRVLCELPAVVGDVPLAACTDTQSDPNNCGGCGVTCTQNQPDCCAGTCVNVLNYANNCGTCGNVCPARSWCGSGTCSEVH